MKAGQKATWDCVWFGNYPQAEVALSDVPGLASAAWDAKGEAVVGGDKYRRLSRNDVNSVEWWDDEDDSEYRYFRYAPIKWRVLEVSDGKALLLADQGLDYHSFYATTWDVSSLRSWLNGYGATENASGSDYSSSSFAGMAFSISEWDDVEVTPLENADNPVYGTEGGESTADKLFVPSADDVFGDAAKTHGFAQDSATYDEGRCCKLSDYSNAMGARRSYSSDYDGFYRGNCWWWLRCPGFNSSTWPAAGVWDTGMVDLRGYFMYYDGYPAVRPALRISSSSDYLSPAGTVCSDGSVDEIAPAGVDYPDSGDTIDLSDEPKRNTSTGDEPKRNTSTGDEPNRGSDSVGSGQETDNSTPSVGLGLGSTATASGSSYQLTGASTVTFKKAKNAKSVTVPATVKLGGKAYKVTKVSANAFTGSKIRAVKLGKNVSKLSKKAFAKSKVTTLVVQSKKLFKPASVKGAFKGAKAKKLTVRYGKVGKKKVVKSFTAKNLGVKSVVLKK